MKRKSIAWILDFTSKLPDDEEKIKCLRANNHAAIKTVLKFCFDPNINWLLPEGEPPYTESLEADENAFYSQARKLYLFVEGGNPNLTNVKREALFINVLESLLEEDAQLLIAIKDKYMPYPGITEELVRKAFPEIF